MLVRKKAAHRKGGSEILTVCAAATVVLFLCPAVVSKCGQASLMLIGHVALPLDQASLMQLVYFYLFYLCALDSF